MAKNIIVCCDGTGNMYGDKKTNVLKLYTALKHGENQITFYDPGLGTFSAPAALTIPAKKITRALGLAFGYGITRNILDGYTHILRNYQPGDKVYLFGFSRGAYTARAIAAMIYKCGLLLPGNENLLDYAVDIFKNKKDVEIYRGFAKTFSQPCPIHFLGLWDTVKSVGWIYDPFTLQFTMNNPIVKTVRHAVAIDERRCFFRQNLWGKDIADQDVKELWFAGVHSNVGGSYPEHESGLSQIALKWIVDETKKAGVKFDAKKLREVLPVKSGEPHSVEEGKPVPPDHTAKMHESLKGAWWIAEYIPKRYQDRNDNFKTKFRLYKGRRRWIAKDAQVHPSVKDRMRDMDYDPENLRR